MAIYQDKDKYGNIIKTKDGRSWYYRVYYTNKFGERKQMKSSKFIKKSDAQNAERTFLNKIENKDVIDVNVSFEDVFYEWLNYKKTQLKLTTFYNLERNTKKHILNKLNRYKLQHVKITTVNEWMIYITNLNYTISYKNSMIGYLRELLIFAKDNYNFDNKIISKIYNLREDGSNLNEKFKNAEWNFWTYEEFKTFINVVDDELYNLIFTFLYFTGLREGEMIALTWNDIDFKNKKLIINKNFTNKIGNKSYAIITPKTKNSNRIIDIDDNLYNRLLKHYNNEKNIYNFNQKMFIFGNVTYITPTTLRRKLNTYINKAQVKKITPHGFRHSHVSLLIDLGCDSRDVANRIGDTVQIVESTYYHMFPKKQSITVNKLNNLEK
jgi:integrase